MNDIKKINAKAKELGLSYGQYVALYEKEIKVMNGQWDDAIFDDFDNGMDLEELSDKYKVKELEIREKLFESGHNFQVKSDLSRREKAIIAESFEDDIEVLSEKGYSVPAIEQILGVDAFYIQKKVDRIKRSRPPEKYNIPREELMKIYPQKKISEIAKIYNCTDETIFRRLQKYGLHQRKYEKRS